MGLLSDIFWTTTALEAIAATGGLAALLLPNNCNGIDGGCGGCDD